MKYFYKIELFYSMEICDCGSTFNPKADIRYIDRYALLKYNSQFTQSIQWILEYSLDIMIVQP